MEAADTTAKFVPSTSFGSRKRISKMSKILTARKRYWEREPEREDGDGDRDDEDEGADGVTMLLAFFHLIDIT